MPIILAFDRVCLKGNKLMLKSMPAQFTQSPFE